MKYNGLIASDFDGTLYLPDNPVSESSLKTFAKLAENKILRVIATGRSLYSAKKVINSDFPVDYMVLSSGAVLMDWAAKKIIYSHSFEGTLAETAAGLLKEAELDFMLHRAFPGSHQFYFHHNGNDNADFDRRLSLYSRHAFKLDEMLNIKQHYSQFVIILREGQEFPPDIVKSIPALHAVRTTSPLDNKSTWIELYPKNVSKAAAVRYIQQMHSIDLNDIWVMGNDYNDLDMLRMTENSFVLESAPEELCADFTVLNASTDDALQKLTEIYFGNEG